MINITTMIIINMHTFIIIETYCYYCYFHQHIIDPLVSKQDIKANFSKK